MTRAAALPLICLLTAVPCACGSGGYAPTDLPPIPRVQPAPASASAPPAGRPARVVRMRNLAFAPRVVTVTLGQSVEWINGDDVRHNVTALDGSTIASPDLAPGARFAYSPARAGRLSYLCTIHPTAMSGVLVVRAR